MCLIKVKNLSKIYTDGSIALDNISFNISKGDFFSILGKNGAGKSTIIGILTSLIKKTSGNIEIFNYNIDTDSNKIKSLIGVVPQEFNFNQFEILIDIILNQAGFYGINRKQAYNKAEYLLKLFDLWEKRNSSAIMLSGGMKRRLMLIRSLIHDPEILILDEPTAGVDISSRKLIWNFLREYNLKNKTIILTTHYLEEVESLCKNLIIIHKGKILSDSSVKNLLKKNDKNILLFYVDDTKKLNNIIIKNFSINIIDENYFKLYNFNNDYFNKILQEFLNINMIIYNIRDITNTLENLFMDITNF
jgi:ABC-2 type transport system ATP-binding protein